MNELIWLCSSLSLSFSVSVSKITLSFLCKIIQVNLFLCGTETSQIPTTNDFSQYINKNLFYTAWRDRIDKMSKLNDIIISIQLPLSLSPVFIHRIEKMAQKKSQKQNKWHKNQLHQQNKSHKTNRANKISLVKPTVQTNGSYKKKPHKSMFNCTQSAHYLGEC